MSPLEWIAAARGLAALYKMLQANKPVSTPLAPLTPEEIAAVDAADNEMNAAVAGWDAGQTSDTPPDNQG
jgi:hypothetical protein